MFHARPHGRAWPDAFGEEQDIVDTDTNHFRYCGEYYDKETKTLYLRARYYSSSTGRFTQEDPIKDGANWYGYCDNNPVNLADPSGLRYVMTKLEEWGGAIDSSATTTPEVTDETTATEPPAEPIDEAGTTSGLSDEVGAIYVVDFDPDSGWKVVGHAVVLIKSEDGTWYSFEFSGKYFWTAKLFDPVKIDDINEELKKERYRYTVEIEGDYTACYDYAKQLIDEDDTYGGYDLLNNNCLDFVQDVLRQGTANDKELDFFIKTYDSLIPAAYYLELKNKAFIHDFYILSNYLIEEVL